MKTREFFTGDIYPNDNVYSMQIVEDHEDYYTKEYYMKIKCVATNSLDAYIFLSGFPVYCEFKINNGFDDGIDEKIVKEILNYISLTNYKDYRSVKREDILGNEFYFLRVFFKNHNIRKKIIKKVRDCIKNKEDNYQIFDLYEDDISTPYSMFIAPRIKIKINGFEQGFPLSKTFKLNRTLSRKIYENKFHYSNLRFIDDIDTYISMFFDFETVDIENMKKGILGRVSIGCEIDQAFMGVFLFFKGRDIIPFHTVAVLLQNEEFPVEYERIDEKLDLIYVKNQKEFFLTKALLYYNFRPEKTGGWNNLGYDWKFTIRKLYELGIFEEFIQIATGKTKSIENIIKFDYRNEYNTVNANEKACHYFLKILGTEEYDQSTMFRQHYQTLSKWSLNTILGKLGLKLKLEFSIKEMYEILYNVYKGNFDEKTKKEKCTLILDYCIRDCIAPKEAIEFINKITEYRIISNLTYIPMYEYSYGNKTKMINNLIVYFANREGFDISIKYDKKNVKEEYEGGLVKDPLKEFSVVSDGCLDFNSLYPSVMMQHNICFLTKLKKNEKEEGCHEISYKNSKGITKIIRFSKKRKGLIPTILELLVKRRKEAKKDRDRHEKSNPMYNYYNILQDTLKKIANSIYGQFGNQYSIICDYEVSASVTGAYARKYIKMASEYMQTKEISETNKEKKFIWKYTDTDSIFFRLSPILINEIIKRYENHLLDKNINEKDFIDVIYNIQKEMVFVTYNESMKLQDEINEWMANENQAPRIIMEMEKIVSPNLYISKKKYNGLIFENSNYFFDDEWKDLEKHIKEEYKIDNVTKEIVNDFVKKNDEYKLLANGKKFSNLLAKGTDLVRRNSTLICRVILKKLLYTLFDYREYGRYLYNMKFTKIEEYQDFINGVNKNDFAKETSKRVVEDFIKYLYSKETELNLELFEQNARNNEEEEDMMTFTETKDPLSITKYTMTSKYKPAEKIKKTYGVSTSTLRRWGDKGDVSCITMPGGKRMYSTEDIDNMFGRESKEKKKICYARVSSEKQKEDLERQCNHLRSEYPEHEIITDIGSGLNWKRKGFTSLLERIYQGDIEEVVVTRKDRLCRFAYELVEWIFKKHEVKLMVLGTDVGSNEPETGELAEDLLSIVTVFTARHNGLRSAANKRKRKEIENSKDTDILRQKCIKIENFQNENKWVLETPYGIRDEALIDLLDAHKSNFKLKRQKFNIRYKKKKDKQHSITIQARDWKRKRGEYAFLKNIRMSEELPNIEHAFNIILDKLGKFYICIPISIEEYYREDNEIISLDPGIRTFMTGYDPIDDCHMKLAKFLCDNYNTILLPKFETQEMVKRIKRKIRNKTARMMITWSHYRFRRFLEHKISEYPGRLLILCNEHYTSKTCGNCGYIKRNFGGSKIYKCDECGFVIDRDYNENQTDWERSEKKDKEYTETILKQENDETTSMVKKFVRDMKMINVEVPKPRFNYYVIYKHGVKEVYKRMVLVDRFDPKKQRIDKYHYLKGIKSFLSVCIEETEKETDEWIKSIIDKNTNKSIDEYSLKEDEQKGGKKRKKKEYDILIPKKQMKISSFFKKQNNDNDDNDFFI
ncbi:8827_t:CDS:2 [Cetraspora pellucida]|uniref:DNA-directed DNA polymerase n=1 Tax=Cetraspora pellucida TaxID=1433469 RepID=A0A9N8VFN0_9GLOM|nr:8827_t:CDS:2 [Cetraspora pellucida]